MGHRSVAGVAEKRRRMTRKAATILARLWLPGSFFPARRWRRIRRRRSLASMRGGRGGGAAAASVSGGGDQGPSRERKRRGLCRAFYTKVLRVFHICGLVLPRVLFAKLARQNSCGGSTGCDRLGRRVTGRRGVLPLVENRCYCSLEQYRARGRRGWSLCVGSGRSDGREFPMTWRAGLGVNPINLYIWIYMHYP